MKYENELTNFDALCCYTYLCDSLTAKFVHVYGYDIFKTSQVNTLCMIMNSTSLYKILELEPNAQIQEGNLYLFKYFLFPFKY